jgi:hypothetical protein
MLSFEDSRWTELKAGYRTPIDLRPLLHRLESDLGARATWNAIWQELYHQGDIGEGSLVAVPHLVRIHRQHGIPDWNTYALVATIELARGRDDNPDVPDWCRGAYDQALRHLAKTGLEELPHAADQETVRSILGILAIVHGARTYGRLLIEFTEDEVSELEEQAFGSPVDPPTLR